MFTTRWDKIESAFVTRRRLAKTAVWCGTVLLAGLIAAELVARYYLGLGDPPLLVADTEIEYLYKPSTEYHRFGNRIAFNSYSMRSDEFPPKKSSADEFRVLVMGDSIVNGGALTDQNQLATTILQRHLRKEMNRPVVVGNVSAGSWGPSNLLAYARRHGFFDADAVVIVLSSHDYADAPTFAPIVGINPAMPDRSPLLAITDAFGRYVLPRLQRSGGEGDTTPSEPSPRDVKTAMDDLRSLLDLARGAAPQVLVFHHCERSELDGDYAPGREEIAEAVHTAGFELSGWRDVFKANLDAGENLYRDHIHPNAVGQHLIAMRIKGELREASDPEKAAKTAW